MPALTSFKCHLNNLSRSLVSVSTDIINIPINLEPVAGYTLKTISGVGGTVLSIFTLGTVKEFNQIAQLRKNSFWILPQLSVSILSPICNINVKYYSNGTLRNKVDVIFEMAIICALKKLTSKSQSKIIQKTVTLMNQTSCVTSRALYAIAATATVVTRFADLIIGVGALAYTVVTRAKNVEVASMALSNLTVFGVINDVAVGIQGILRPTHDW